VQKRLIAGFLIDIVLVTISFAVCVKLKPGDSSVYYSNYFSSFLIFLLTWVTVSTALKKYRFFSNSGMGDVVKVIIVNNLIIFFLISSMIYLFQSFHYSRFIVLGTVGVSTFAELSLGLMYFLVVNTKVRYENDRIMDNFNREVSIPQSTIPVARLQKGQIRYDYKSRIEFLKKEIGEEAFSYIVHYGAIDSPNTLVVGTTTRFTIDAQIQPVFEAIINIGRVNDFRYINKFFAAVNAKLPVGGVFIDFFEPKTMRKERLLNKYPLCNTILKNKIIHTK